MKHYKKIISGITGSHEVTLGQARKHLDALVKPPGSLGGLEDIAAKMAAITGEIKNHQNTKQIIVFASDNGVYEEGVASAPQAVTLIQSLNMLKGVTGVCVLAKVAGSSVKVIDVGINADIKAPGLVDCKIRKSTNNIAIEPAMTYEEAEKAIEIGMDAVKKAHEEGYNLLGIGEMGIGNTTTSSAVLSVLLGLKEDEINKTVGRGAGLTDEAYEKKIEIIKKAIAINKPNQNDVIDVLAKVGGFDIAAMCGAFLGAAYYKIPVVIDGFISIVAAICAIRLSPTCQAYMFASHLSFERGYKLAMDELGLKAYLDMNMRLGEGSGCPLMFQLIDAACAMISNMATFEEAMMDTEYLEKINVPGTF